MENTENARCINCGAEIKENTEYCSKQCEKQHKAHLDSPLYKFKMDVDAYNKEHGTDYSYGYYLAYIEPALKREANKHNKSPDR